MKIFLFCIVSGNDLPDQENLIHQLCQKDLVIERLAQDHYGHPVVLLEISRVSPSLD